MIKTRRKGNRTLRRSIDYLESLGYLIDTCEKSGKFLKTKDLFGLFDCIAINCNHVLFVQVKTNQPANLTDLKSFSSTYYKDCVCMTWYDYSGWVIHWINDQGILTKEDLRKKRKCTITKPKTKKLTR